MLKKSSLDLKVASQNFKNIRLLSFLAGLFFIFICQFIKTLLINNLQAYKLNFGFSFFSQTESSTISTLIIIFSIFFLCLTLLVLFFASNFWIILSAIFFLTAGFSNLFDRLIYDGAVVDYIKFSFLVLNNKILWFNLEDFILLINSFFLMFFLIKNHLFNFK